MNNYIILNNYPINENASLKDLRMIVSKFNAKLLRAYTFGMKNQNRRVIKLIADGLIYQVGTKTVSWSGTIVESFNPIMLTTNKELAYKVCDEQTNGYVYCMNAKDIIS